VTEKFLSSWRDGPTKQGIDFVTRTCGESGFAAVTPEERVAVFDNDGTLWCEKPMPIQLDFILRRLGEMVADRPELAEGNRGRQARLTVTFLNSAGVSRSDVCSAGWAPSIDRMLGHSSLPCWRDAPRASAVSREAKLHAAHLPASDFASTDFDPPRLPPTGCSHPG
jgi:hypothetical protein